MKSAISKSSWRDGLSLMSLGHSLGRGSRNRNRVRLRPDGGTTRKVEAVHRDFEAAVIDIHVQIVIVHFLTLKGIVLRAFNRIRVRAGATGHKVSDASVFVALIVVNVPGKNDDAGAHINLPSFQQVRHFFLWRAGRVASAEHFGV